MRKMRLMERQSSASQKRLVPILDCTGTRAVVLSAPGQNTPGKRLTNSDRRDHRASLPRDINLADNGPSVNTSRLLAT
jgi:hypothetical protein